MPRLPALLFLLLLSSSALSSTISQLQNELDQKQYSRAAQTGLAILRQQPENIQARFLTAFAFQQNNQSTIAQRYYQQIIKTNPELPEPSNNLAIIYIDQGQYDQAINLLIASLKTHPAYATAWQNLNLLYQGLASEAYRKALSTDKNSHSVMNKIQLSALSTLHDFTALPPTVAVKPVDTVQLAAATLTDKKAVKTITTQKPSKEDLIKPLQDWSTAWSNKELNSYVNAYVKGYKGGKANHKAWVNYRRSRILKPGAIEVKLSNFQIKSQSDSRVIIDFHQQFKSATYRDKVAKRIHLAKIDNQWKITRESTLSVF